MLCEVCGKGEVEHRCKACKRWVCSRCYDVFSGLCVECLGSRVREAAVTPLASKILPLMFMIPMLAVFIGFTLVLLGMLSGGEVGYGGFIVIGPFPILFGKNISPATLAIGGVVLTVIAVVLTLLPLLLRRIL